MGLHRKESRERERPREGRGLLGRRAALSEGGMYLGRSAAAGRGGDDDQTVWGKLSGSRRVLFGACAIGGGRVHLLD